MKRADPGSLVIVSFFHSSPHQELEKLKCIFILYNLQLEIINFLYKNLRKAECWLQLFDHVGKRIG